ncbi:ATPase domain-containing protein [Halomarina salina]|uniref:ATPase domain-containing protein n=1 Tax=Halomarina salina TaxID=1872699 RepID=A0ABD5RL57_9EURY|nr:ATPase domain-containing protein [Halomarina salina]
MDYELAIETTPETVPGGTGIMLLHPSTGETDRIDTDFFKTDTDHLFILSTRTTAREVQQKLEYYEVDETKATILDTLSIERGYSRRSGQNIRYVPAPDDLDGMVEAIETFLQSHDGKLRISIDSVTEMAYYADEERVRTAVEQILDLLDEYDAIGLFHVAEEVHEGDVVEGYRDLFDGVIELEEDGRVESQFK